MGAGANPPLDVAAAPAAARHCPHSPSSATIVAPPWTRRDPLELRQHGEKEEEGLCGPGRRAGVAQPVATYNFRMQNLGLHLGLCTQ
jgi:hypothetical protein